MRLSGKHIVLGVTGSIAAYKAASLARLLIKEGAEVQVLMTPSAKEFIAPLTMATLTQKPVASEFFDRRDGSWYSHVDLGLWADLMLIAPASAASIAKMATGVADNMLVTTYLSMKAPVWIAPAMDLDMYAHAATQSNLDILKARGDRIVDAASGFLASGLEGKGRMQAPEAIAGEVCRYFEEKHLSNRPLKEKKVLITAGPTYEAIDAVRFLGNHSTGRMGFALAEEAHNLGAEVVLVIGPTQLEAPTGITVVKKIVSAEEMLSFCKEAFPSCDIAIFSAAVADYRPAKVADGKLKRAEEGEEFTLQLVKNPDIAAIMGKQRRQNQLLVGFALETSANHEEAIEKMNRKGMDMMVLNSLSDEGAGFATLTNQVTILDKSGNAHAYGLKDKREVAKDIFAAILDKLALR